MSELTNPALACKYFDVILEFGLHENSDRIAPTLKLSIPMRLPGKGRSTAYGGTVEEVCQRALDWLEPNGWVGRGELMKRGLRGAAETLCKIIGVPKPVELYGEKRSSLERAIVGAMKATVSAHGHITMTENCGSAAKRIIGVIKNHNKELGAAMKLVLQQEREAGK